MEVYFTILTSSCISYADSRAESPELRPVFFISREKPMLNVGMHQTKNYEIYPLMLTTDFLICMQMRHGVLDSEYNLNCSSCGLEGSICVSSPKL